MPYKGIVTTYIIGSEPKIGDIAKGTDIGKKYTNRFVWLVCETCGKPRWVVCSNLSKTCRTCHGKSRLIPSTYVVGSEPNVGDIARAKDINISDKYGGRYIWLSCEGCGKKRWAQYAGYIRRHSTLCPRCSFRKRSPPHFVGGKHWHWSGGKYISKGPYKGYVMIWVDPSDNYASMRDKRGYCPEHRLVMAKYLGRCLNPEELVHHKMGIR